MTAKGFRPASVLHAVGACQKIVKPLGHCVPLLSGCGVVRGGAFLPLQRLEKNLRAFRPRVESLSKPKTHVYPQRCK